jgi:hypothetical protein
MKEMRFSNLKCKIWRLSTGDSCRIVKTGDIVRINSVGVTSGFVTAYNISEQGLHYYGRDVNVNRELKK